MAPKVRCFMVVLLILFGLSPVVSPVWAGSESEEESIQTFQLTVAPKGEPEYALEYVFETPYMDQRRGNGALLYESALTLMEGVKNDLVDFDEDKISEWQGMEPEDMPLKEVREIVSRFDNAIHYADLASRCEYCTWEYPIREEGIRCVMPKLGSFRHLTRILVLKARLAAADGDIAGAIDTLRIGISMGRDVGDGPFLIQGLVGIAVNAVMLRDMQHLIELPDTPNLYWALTSLPRPLVDMRRAMQVESDMLYVELPELKTLETEVWSDEEALKLGRKITALVSGDWYDEAEGAESLMAKAGMLAGAIMVYPEAKKSLIERGRAVEEVEAMPPLQAILIYKHQQYRRVRDMLFKWCNLPYWQVKDGFKKADQMLSEYMGGSKMDAIANVLMYTMPAIDRVCMLRSRFERDIGMLRCVEAIRMYAAEHGGKLPRSLDDISSVPVPMDPMYGRAFHYEVSGRKCVLESPVPEGGHRKDGLRIEITMKKASR